MSRAVEESNRRMLRARDAVDRDYAQPLDVSTLAKIAYVSEAHFIRTFRATFGETRHQKLLARGVEFTEEPTERFYGTDCGLRDPFGNHLRIGQPKEGPIEVPDPAQFAAENS